VGNGALPTAATPRFGPSLSGKLMLMLCAEGHQTGARTSQKPPQPSVGITFYPSVVQLTADAMGSGRSVA
jgi:hypothetical protein